MNKLDQIFKRLGIRPTPWAIRNGLSGAAISRARKGHIGPKNARKIARALNNEITETELLYSDPEPQNPETSADGAVNS